MNKPEAPSVWTIDKSEYVVNDAFLKLRADTCTTPEGGKVDRYYVLELDDWINCIVIDEDANVIMLKHYRHGIRNYLMEFVGGGIEKTDTTPEAAARREVEEETGYHGGTFYHVGTGYPNPANHTNKVHTFLAVGGKITREPNPEVGESIIVERIPFKTVLEMMSAPGAIYPSLYTAALFFVVNYLRTSSDPSLEYLKKYL